MTGSSKQHHSDWKTPINPDFLIIQIKSLLLGNLTPKTPELEEDERREETEKVRDTTDQVRTLSRRGMELVLKSQRGETKRA